MSDDVATGVIAILDKRLGSIEIKLDKLIRLEERQETQSADIKRVFVKVEKAEDRIRQLEISAGESSVRTNHNSGSITLFVSAITSVVVAVIVWNLKG
jgi:hypothetical protein